MEKKSKEEQVTCRMCCGRLGMKNRRKNKKKEEGRSSEGGEDPSVDDVRHRIGSRVSRKRTNSDPSGITPEGLVPSCPCFSNGRSAATAVGPNPFVRGGDGDDDWGSSTSVVRCAEDGLPSTRCDDDVSGEHLPRFSIAAGAELVLGGPGVTFVFLLNMAPIASVRYRR